MNKRVVILAAPGLPYRKTVLYGIKRARELGATLAVLGIVPEFDEAERTSLAFSEIQPYGTVARGFETDASEHLERIIRCCLDFGVQVETRLERGRIEAVVRRITADKRVELVVVPSPTRRTHQSLSFDTIRNFVHSMTEQDLGCPVVSVLAT